MWVHDHASLVDDPSGRPSLAGRPHGHHRAQARGGGALAPRQDPRSVELRGRAVPERAGVGGLRRRRARAGRARRPKPAAPTCSGTSCAPDGTMQMTQIFEWTAAGIDPTIDLDITSNLPYAESGFARWERGPVRGRPHLRAGPGVPGLGTRPAGASGHRVHPGRPDLRRAASGGASWATTSASRSATGSPPRSRRSRSSPTPSAPRSAASARCARCPRPRPGTRPSSSRSRPSRTWSRRPSPAGSSTSARRCRRSSGFDQAEWSHEGWLRGIHAGRSRTRARRGPPDARDRRAVQLRVPDGPPGRTGRVAPGRRRPVAGRPRRSPLLAGGAVRRHRPQGSRDAPPRGGAALPDARRADPRDHLHRREPRPERIRLVAHDLHQSTGRAHPGLHTRGVERRRRALWSNIIHPDDRDVAVEANRRPLRGRASRSRWSSG